VDSPGIEYRLSHFVSTFRKEAYLRIGEHATDTVSHGSRIVGVKCNCGWSTTGMHTRRLVVEAGQHYFFKATPSFRDVSIEGIAEETARRLMQDQLRSSFRRDTLADD